MFKFEVVLYCLLFFQAWNQSQSSKRQIAEVLTSPWHSEKRLSNCRTGAGLAEWEKENRRDYPEHFSLAAEILSVRC